MSSNGAKYIIVPQDRQGLERYKIPSMLLTVRVTSQGFLSLLCFSRQVHFSAPHWRRRVG